MTGQRDRIIKLLSDALPLTHEDILELPLDDLIEELVGKNERDVQSIHSSVEIVRARIRSLLFYEVSEAELDSIEKESPSSLFLNFFILTFSTALAFLISLLTVSFPSERTFTVFVVVTAIGFLSSAVLLAVWLRSRKNQKDVLNAIRDRRPSR